MAQRTQPRFDVSDHLKIGKKSYRYYSLSKAGKILGFSFDLLPFSLKILAENLLRFYDGKTVTMKDLQALDLWLKHRHNDHEIAYHPSRVLMQDFTGVPAIVDLAAMRDAVSVLGGNPAAVNPLIPVDLVIDHSVTAIRSGTAKAFDENVAIEMHDNHERYTFLRWGQQAFSNFRVVPPGTGICHQVNLEYLASVVSSSSTQDSSRVLAPSLRAKWRESRISQR